MAAFVNENKMLVLKTHDKYGNRSNWLGLWNFGFYLKQSCTYSPGKLKDNLNQLRKIDKAEYEKAEREQRNYEKTRRSMDAATNYGRFSNRRFPQTTL
jgi:hypothetical protein